ncbi:MAG: multicopper oxidase domain-containing protein, partial [Candidatus Baltobacteraceae bacterium]
MLACALPPLRGRTAEADVVEYALRAGPLQFAPTADVSFAALAYNGTLPGPLLRVVHGQRVRVRYRND